MNSGALDHSVLFDRGVLNLLHLDDRKLARSDLAAATRIAPNRAAYWYYYAEALIEDPNSEKPECPAVKAFERFLELCGTDSDCNGDDVKTALFFTTVRPELYGSC